MWRKTTFNEMEPLARLASRRITFEGLVSNFVVSISIGSQFGCKSLRTTRCALVLVVSAAELN